MPRKIRELRADLRREGFEELRGRGDGSHSFWRHRAGPTHATLSGATGADAQPYQEKHVAQVIAAAAAAQRSKEETP